MTDYYVDPAATGANDGSSWTDAWTSLQTALDTVTAGNTIFCRGTQVLSAVIDVDTNSGNETSGLIKIIGVNSSGTNDGTRFVLNGNSAATYCLNTSAANYLYWENIEFENATSHGVSRVTGDNVVWLNCSSHNNGGAGWESGGGRHWFILCCAYNNSGHGFELYSASRLLFCSSHDNGDSGLGGLQLAEQVCIGCLLFDNTDDGVEGGYQGALYFNCAIDGNGDDGVQVQATTAFISGVIGCRITNHSGAGDIGLNCNGEIILHGWNYFENNDGNNIQNNTLAIQISPNGSATNVEDQSNTNQGFTDLTDGAENFNLRTDASLRRTAILVPLT